MASPSMRPSPFARPTTPSTVRAQSPQPTSNAPPSPQQTPTSPMRSPERQQSPFVRRPSQLGSPQRAMSPFAARPPSRLNVIESSEDDLSPTKTSPIPFHLPTASVPKPITTPTSAPSPIPNTFTPVPAVSVSRPQPQRTVTASSTTTVRPEDSAPSLAGPPRLRAGNYSHVAPTLLHTMRESFEVLDSSSSGQVTGKDLAAMLEQLGHDDVSASTLAPYFNGKDNINLSRFLDGLATPMRDLSEPEELAAAFAAFDVDDSGQIDLAELRSAVLDAARADGEAMSGSMVDGILDEFRARRAFGSRGVLGKELGAGTRGDVFRYRDFMSAITGAGTATA